MQIERNDDPGATKISWDTGRARICVSVSDWGIMNVSCCAGGISTFLEITDIPVEEMICMLLDAKRLIAAKNIADKLRGDNRDPDDIPF